MGKYIWIYLCLFATAVLFTSAFPPIPGGEGMAIPVPPPKNTVDKEGFTTCNRHLSFMKKGCYYQDVLKNETFLISDRVWNDVKLDWSKFAKSIHSLVCRCSEAARKGGYKLFSIRYWAVCYGKTASSEELATLGDVTLKKTECANQNFTACDDKEPTECVGKAWHDYLYETRPLTPSGPALPKLPTFEVPKWGPWTAWPKCNTTYCGPSGQSITRSRQCSVKDMCTGKKVESMQCKKNPCLPPVDGGLGEWGAWGTCSKSCGGGMKTRRKLCNNPPPANGGKDCFITHNKLLCNQFLCPAGDAGYTSWTGWSTCQPGCQQKRERTCDNKDIKKRTDCFPQEIDVQNKVCASKIDCVGGLPSAKANTFAIKKSEILTTLDVFGKEYTVSFDVKPTGWTSGWTSVIHFSQGGDSVTYGDRTPAAFFRDGYLYICGAVNGTANYFKKTPAFTKDVWTSVKIVQMKSGGVYHWKFFMNNKMIHETVNRKPEDFRNVKVYGSDPWYNEQAGFIRNLVIKGPASKTCMRPCNSTDWSKWGTCSRPCSTGTRRRYNGATEEKGLCNKNVCPKCDMVRGIIDFANVKKHSFPAKDEKLCIAQCTKEYVKGDVNGVRFVTTTKSCECLAGPTYPPFTITQRTKSADLYCNLVAMTI